jgi:hypothetical protein
MDSDDFKIPVDQFSEYAMILENADYPKTDFTQLGFRGQIDTAAMAEAYAEAVAQVPIFSAHMVHERNGIWNIPYWVPGHERKNRLIIEDCRHLVTEPFEPMDFSTLYHSKRTCRQIDLTREFPFNAYLVRVTDDRYIFSIVYHHSCMDPAKFYVVMTKMLSGYHERVKGELPEWAIVDGMSGLARPKKLVKPEISFGKFMFEQFADIWYHNPKSKVAHVATKKVYDYRQRQGRHSVRAVIDDPKLLAGMSKRVKRHKATVNDLLLACVQKAITQWNSERNAGHDRYRFMLISSLKGRKDNKVNKSGAAVSGIQMISRGHRDTSLDTLIEWFRDQRVDMFKKGYDLQFNNLIARFIDAFRLMPFGPRRRLSNLIVEGTPVTMYLSNVGIVWPKIVNGKPTLDSAIPGAGDFLIDDIHSSASLSRDFGFGMTTRTHNRRFYINFVMDRFRWSKPEALEIRDAIVKEIVEAIS